MKVTWVKCIGFMSYKNYVSYMSIFMNRVK